MGLPRNSRKFPTPIPLGVSGINNNDAGYGTLGSLLQDSAGNQYILSNNHVLAQSNQAALGEDIIHPGLWILPFGAYFKVAELTEFIFISNGDNSVNFVDAAIAKVEPGKVNSKDEIYGLLKKNNLGTPSSWPLFDPPLGMPVMKAGRTTGHTEGRILSVAQSATVNGCRFFDLIVIEGEPAGTTFAKPGDSGALVVSKPDPSGKYGAHPVGLLFAGSSAGANPISVSNSIWQVFEAFPGLAIVGTDDEPMVLPDPETPITPVTAAIKAPVMIAAQDNRIFQLRSIINRHASAIRGIPGVVGIGVALPRGATTPVIQIYVEKDTPELKQLLPATLDGEPVQVVETGPIRFE